MYSLDRERSSAQHMSLFKAPRTLDTKRRARAFWRAVNGRLLAFTVVSVPSSSREATLTLARALCIFAAFVALMASGLSKDEQETLRLLVQHVSRAFYEPRFTVVMDQLVRHPV